MEMDFEEYLEDFYKAAREYSDGNIEYCDYRDEGSSRDEAERYMYA